MRLRFDEYGSAKDDAPPLLVAHGLLGAARNWRALSRRLARGRRVIAVDMRNHGDSGWSDDATYPAMAQDLADTLAALGIDRADVLGHSMGGKAAMALALTQPRVVRKLVVADIAPVRYGHSHLAMLDAMAALDLSAIQRRSDAERMLEPAVPERPMRAFLSQNLEIEDGAARWRPNLSALRSGMDDLVDWPDAFDGLRFEGPALFLRGGASDYVADDALPTIRAAFPEARLETLDRAGHWLHAERPESFIDAVAAFLDAQERPPE
jgi:pimeloyl-ACP methyl ester carboxylesterase